MARHKRPSLTELDASPVMPDTVDEMYDIFLAREAKPLIRDVRVDLIEPNPFQARKEFPDIDELAQSIRIHGFTSRLRVRPHPEIEGTYQLVYGERRLRAAKTAGLSDVPCEIVRHSDIEMVEIGLAENIQRRDLTPLEEAQALKGLMDYRGYSQRELAERLGKNIGYVQNRLDLLRAPEDVQQLVAQRPDSIRAARSIARLADPAQRQPLIKALMSGDLTGDDVVLRVRDMLDRSAPADPLVSVSIEHGMAEAGNVGTTELDDRGTGEAVSHLPPGRPPRTDRDTKSPAMRASAMARILESDVLRVDVMLSRWRQALSRATTEERRAFAAYLRDHLSPQLDGLQQTAEASENASS